MSKDLTKATQNIATLFNTVDDLENRPRINNICLVGVPQKAVGHNAMEFINSAVTDSILCAARELKEVSIDGQSVLIFPDFSSEVQKETFKRSKSSFDLSKFHTP